ncbi:retrovirus-related pol polyprotein from transposon TNT 1-94 [Tanacetum coccineum]
MTGDRSRLKNFVKKFIGTVRFGNDHFGAIMGYGDYVISESVISRVYYMEGLGHNLFFVSQFCDSDLEVAFRMHSCYIRDTDGVELIKVQTINGKKYILVIVDDYSRFTWVKFLRSKDETLEVVIKFLKQIQVGLNKTVRNIRTDNGTEFVNKDLTDYYERVDIFHQKTVSRTPQQNDIVETRNRTLVEAARTMLIFSKALTFLWVEVVATSLMPFVTQQMTAKILENNNQQLILEYSLVMHLAGKGIKSTTKEPDISSRLVPNPVPAAPYVPPTNKDLEILFQPMFDEYLEPPCVERPVFPALAVQVPVNSTGTPSSTTIDQDAPSPSHSPSSLAIQSPSLHQGFAAESTLMEDNPFAPTDNDPFINMFSSEPRSEASSSGDLSSTASPYVSQTLNHLEK